MIDHILGRPSVKFRKVQVLAVVSFWSFYLLEGNKNGPPMLRTISKILSKRITPWQTMILTMLWLYLTRNFAKICNLESPEPLANLYTRSFFRATWITTALDAGFWTAMRIKQRWLRDIMSLVCTVYYLIAAEQADDKVRRVRATLTVEHLRVSWNKSTTPYLSLLINIMRPKFTKYTPKKIRIPRPPGSSYKEPIIAWLYYDGPFSTIGRHNKVILDVPGGGFVAMNPRNHDDKLFAWSGKTGLPVISLDYRKAPEYPYPYALNECYDAYHTLVASQGRCIGLPGDKPIKVVVTGDSAGGNLATGLILMILQQSKLGSSRGLETESLPIPDGLILLYPALEMNMNSWMTDEQMSLIHSQRRKEANQRVLRKKSQDFYRHDPSTPVPSDDEEEKLLPPAGIKPSHSQVLISSDDDLLSPQPPKREDSISAKTAEVALAKPRVLKTRLAMSSMISYVNDRVITPEMMRAMVILYVGPHARPDFSTDYLLSPIVAPDILLAEFPKTYFLTGERDPLVDDTVIFAGRLRQAKYAKFLQRQEMGLVSGSRRFDERDHVEVNIIPGISHGFVQFVGVFPEAWRYIFRCTRWMSEVFDLAERDELSSPSIDHTQGSISSQAGIGSSLNNSSSTIAAGVTTVKQGKARHHFRSGTESSFDDDHPPLEMTKLKIDTKINNARALQSNSTTTAAAAAAAAATISNKSQADTQNGRSSTASRNKRATTDAGHGYTRGRGRDRNHHRENGKGRRDDDIDIEGEERTGEREEGEVSVVSAASEEDLLKRRMRGFTAGLIGDLHTADE